MSFLETLINQTSQKQRIFLIKKWKSLLESNRKRRKWNRDNIVGGDSDLFLVNELFELWLLDFLVRTFLVKKQNNHYKGNNIHVSNKKILKKTKKGRRRRRKMNRSVAYI